MSEHGVPHHAANAEQKKIGIAIAIIAVVVAVVTALANNEANKMIVKEVQASNKEVKASNGFAWYQAKRQRSYLNDLEIKRIDFELAGSANEAQRKLLEGQQARLTAKNAEYETEGKAIIADAETDRASAEADRTTANNAAHKHHRFEYAEILLHIAVVLCSLTLLTDQKLFYRLGLAATVGGVILTIAAFSITPHTPGEPSSSSAPHVPPQ